MKGNIKSFLKVFLLSVIWAGNTFAVLAQQPGNVIITGTVTKIQFGRVWKMTISD